MALVIDILIFLAIQIHCTANSVQFLHDVESRLGIVDTGDEAKQISDMLNNPVEVLVMFENWRP